MKEKKVKYNETWQLFTRYSMLNFNFQPIQNTRILESGKKQVYKGIKGKSDLLVRAKSVFCGAFK